MFLKSVFLTWSYRWRVWFGTSVYDSIDEHHPGFPGWSWCRVAVASLGLALSTQKCPTQKSPAQSCESSDIHQASDRLQPRREPCESTTIGLAGLWPGRRLLRRRTMNFRPAMLCYPVPNDSQFQWGDKRRIPTSTAFTGRRTLPSIPHDRLPHLTGFHNVSMESSGSVVAHSSPHLNRGDSQWLALTHRTTWAFGSTGPQPNPANCSNSCRSFGSKQPIQMLQVIFQSSCETFVAA